MPRLDLAPHSRPHGVAWYAPDRVAVTAEGSRTLLLSGDGSSAYVAATMGDSMVQFDRRTLAIVRTIAVTGEPDGLARTDSQPRAVCHGCRPLPGEG